ncbi:hypothetical protein [Janthinobacterium sp. 17J80-10]|uniref:hypothetical protein n=1 Tax=Janthinobacterium sp. 17J80-10 TaxID=2497863 RepID=UPI0010058D9F|nr:hypothetical protein [Janthinobacterium sp. 17J80-10]QAU34678.1 hypothetical protein EKL02_11050 [Janthinobacterium sp. 17J80-10]
MSITLRAVLLGVLSIISNASAAVTRHDVLECGLSDGSKFILRSAYEFSLVPLPLRHASRESNRKDWEPTYWRPGKDPIEVPRTVRYSSKANLHALKGVCSHFGLVNGHPIIGASYLKDDGTWFYREDFPWKKLQVEIQSMRNDLTPTQSKQLQNAGIKRTSGISLLAPKNTRLVWEQPLQRKLEGYEYAVIVDAVYQAFSEDGGKTWSEPIVTTKAELFEIGKPWCEQSFLAKPISINGQEIKTD